MVSVRLDRSSQYQAVAAEPSGGSRRPCNSEVVGVGDDFLTLLFYVTSGFHRDLRKLIAVKKPYL